LRLLPLRFDRALLSKDVAIENAVYLRRSGGKVMTYTLSQLLSFEEFLAQYGNNPRYELADGELIDMEPTGSHETVAGKLASKLSVELERQGHPWFIPRTCIVRPFT